MKQNRRVFLKKAAGTTLAFGVGVSLMPDAGAVTLSGYDGCSGSTYNLSGQVWCKVECGSGKNCDPVCSLSDGTDVPMAAMTGAATQDILCLPPDD